MPTMRVSGGPLVNKVLLVVPAKKLVEDGKYDLTNHNIPFDAFPSDPTILHIDDQYHEVRSDDVYLLSCDADLKGPDARRMIDELGFAPVNGRATLCFGINHPDEQRTRVLVGLGGCGGCAVYLYGDDAEKYPRRKLYAGGTSDYWEAGCKFLCVKK